MSAVLVVAMEMHTQHACISLLKAPIVYPAGEVSLQLAASACREAAMDEGKLEQQVASVGRGMAFLKQEHLAMLTGLQLEITRLKRRCHGEPGDR